MQEGFYTIGTVPAGLARRRHNQTVELADWDALDLDVLASDREMWAEGAVHEDESAKALKAR